MYGSLDNCSAFKYENYLGILKRSIRSGKNPVAQIVHRMRERESISPVSEKKQETVINCKPPNNWYIDNEHNHVIEVGRCDQGTNNYICKRFSTTYPFFTFHNGPCDSRLVGIYKIVNQEGRNVLLSELELSRMSRGFRVALSQSSSVIHTILHTEK